MKNRTLAVFGVAVLALSILTACTATNVWAQIKEWAPVAVTAFTSYVNIADPNSTLSALGTTLQNELTTVETTSVAAAAAGAGLSAQQKVVTELQVFVNNIPAFESAAASSGDLSTTDKDYIVAGATVFDTAATIYLDEATSASQPLQSARGICYEVNVKPDGSTTAWIDCTGDHSDAIFASLDPIPQTSQPTSVKFKVSTKNANLGNFKRQINSLAKKYGHQKPLKLTWSERLHIN